ncbi:HD domain-containing phosphohydrolase [Oceanospirillum maris]|uniref:HD domain-containing phosphohydrolase n=1 Tax=Oceanospirillum maris TaxID=64977 RepID=UPI000482FC2C|nr:HD domain-containing phosphohydrolase [Oceanospirillum maris]
MRLMRQGISLQWLIGGAMFCAMLLLSALLVVQNYQNNKNALLVATAESARQLSDTLNEKAKRLTGPAQSALQILSYDPLLTATNLEGRQQRLPVLFETLNSNIVLSAIYAGYSTGEFFLLRKLNDQTMIKKFNAPQGTAFLLQTLSLQPDINQGMRKTWFYYDNDQNLLSQQNRPDYQYDPRTRPWFNKALTSEDQILTNPYLFFSTREIGITLAKRGRNSQNIIGMDASVTDLAAQISMLKLTTGSELVAVDGQNKILAHADTEKMIVREDKYYRMNTLAELESPILRMIAEDNLDPNELKRFNAKNQEWYGLWIPITGLNDQNIKVILAIPSTELLANAKDIILKQTLWTVAVILIVLLLGLYGGARIGRAFRQLTEQVRALSGFDFSSQVHIHSDIREAKELSQVVGNMSRTIDSFQAISLCLNRESDLEKMLDGVLENLVTATGMSSGAIYLYHSEEHQFTLTSSTVETGFSKILTEQGQDDASILHHTLEQLEKPKNSLVISLRKRDDSLEGLLVMHWKKVPKNKKALIRFVSELAGSAAVAIETRRLIDGQKELIEGILRLLADAIDAKSPYTSGHCERVPQLAFQFIETLSKQTQGEFAHFKLSAQDEEAFRIAAWLHDCGKILSPEHVIDKATKLETIFNRIHEIRARFEILWRDAEIHYWQQIAQGQPEEHLKNALKQRQEELIEQFNFLAKTNEGTEFLSPDTLDRINTIGDQEWVRHFDNTLGLSHEELDRLQRSSPQPSLPATETLLADKPEHIIPWGEGRRPPVEASNPDNIWGFDMALPEHSFNLGERYNLSIRAGTLTPEERFKINEHSVHTIMMLNALPLPEYLKKVPQMAGNHHERIDGQGYPRKLSGSEMTPPEKVMAIADIFEALTASDRPYKKPKTVSEALNIMVKMTLGGHIDPALFATLLKEQSFSQYAQDFLDPEQNDAVDYQALLVQLSQLDLA